MGVVSLTCGRAIVTLLSLRKISTMAKTKKSNPDNEGTLVKLKPSILPMGFAIGQVEEDFIVIEFIDSFDGVTTIIESIALPKSKASQLANALTKALESDVEQS